MLKMHSFKISALLCAGIVMLTVLPGCTQEDFVHQKSLAELNTKAQQMLQAGDVNGAVSRLEAAHDLSPGEANTTFNLAIAYQTQGSHDRAIELFKQLLDKPGQNKSEIEKNLGITYEAKADTLEANTKGSEAGAKNTQTQTEQTKQDVIYAYQLALEHYQAALNGSKSPTDIQKQIEVLQAKLKHPQEQAAL